MTTIVTVAYEGDYRGLRLQARSLAKFCPPETVTRIILIENFATASGPGWREPLLREYGANAGKVSFVAASDLIAEPSEVDGWWSQQALKLLVAKLVETPEYLILDGKHHLLRPLVPSFWRNEAGKLRVRGATYNGHPLQEQLNNALNWFGLPLTAANWFPTTTPPFPIDTKVALDVLDYAQSQSDASLLEFMFTNQLTEFFLYSAYLLATDRMDDLYELHLMPYPCVWAGQHDHGTVDAVVNSARDSESPFFGLHRRAVPLLHHASVSAIAELWSNTGLLPLNEGLAYLADWQRSERQSGRVGRFVKRARSFARSIVAKRITREPKATLRH